MRRVSFGIDTNLYRRFRDIPWGTRSHLLRKMVEHVCILWEIEGHAGIARILDGEHSPDPVQDLNVIDGAGSTHGQT